MYCGLCLSFRIRKSQVLNPGHKTFKILPDMGSRPFLSYSPLSVAYPGILFGGRGVSTHSVENRGRRERESGGGSPLVRSSGGSCNLVQEISFHIVKFGTLRLFMMATNLFVIGNVKQLRTGGSFRILLPFFRTSWGVGVLNSALFNSSHNRVEFGTILEGLRNLGGGRFEPPNQLPPRYAWSQYIIR